LPEFYADQQLTIIAVSLFSAAGTARTAHSPSVSNLRSSVASGLPLSAGRNGGQSVVGYR